MGHLARNTQGLRGTLKERHEQVPCNTKPRHAVRPSSSLATAWQHADSERLRRGCDKRTGAGGSSVPHLSPPPPSRLRLGAASVPWLVRTRPLGVAPGPGTKRRESEPLQKLDNGDRLFMTARRLLCLCSTILLHRPYKGGHRWLSSRPRDSQLSMDARRHFSLRPNFPCRLFTCNRQ